MARKNRDSNSIFILAISIFFAGMCGISYEYTLSKLFTDLLGNSTQQWAIVIGLMLLFMGIGADAQKRIPDSHLADSFIITELGLAFLGAISPIFNLWTFGKIHEHFFLLQYVSISLIGFLIGIEIPILARIFDQLKIKIKVNLGMIFKFDYIGSFVGALIWTFWLIKEFDVIQTSLILGITNVFIAAITIIVLVRRLHFIRAYLAVIITFTFVIISLLWNSSSVKSYLEQPLYLDPIVYSKTTPYQKITITRLPNGGINFYINGNLQFSSFDEHIYHEFLVHPLLSNLKNKQKVLILGGGDGLAAREIWKHPEVKSLSLIDLDPAMTEIAKTQSDLLKLNQGSLLSRKLDISDKPQGIQKGTPYQLEETGNTFFRRSRRIKKNELFVRNIDAYQFLENAKELYDGIIVDFPDPNNVNLSKLYSFEFFKQLKKKLSNEGCFSIQSTSPTHAKEVFLMIGRTIKKAGFVAVPYHYNVPSFGDWGWWIACHQEIYSEASLIKKMKSIKILPETRFLTADLVNSSLIFGKNALESREQGINRLLEDKIYQLYKQAWKNR